MKISHSLILTTSILAYLLSSLVISAFAADVTECDTLASSELDIGRVATPVTLDKINLAAAESACRDAILNDPNNRRLQFLYGRVFEVKKDFINAALWYQKSVSQNYLVAYHSLGSLYQNGKGVIQDDKKALELFQKSADQNFAPSQFEVGYAYEMGYGVDQSYLKAKDWYSKSATQNFGPAQNNLGYMYQNGEGTSVDINKAFEWYSKAAANGEPYANLNLGAFYHNGQVVNKNEGKALEQFRIASERGLMEASIELLFSFAEAKYPNVFPGFAYSQPDFLPPPFDIYQYRHYTVNGSDVYIGCNLLNQHLYYYAPASSNQLLDLGTINVFLNEALAYEKTINPH